MHEHLFIFRKPEKGEKLEKYKESIKWWTEQLFTEKFPQGQDTLHKQTTMRGVEAFETKLNPYGFIYIPKNALAALPLKIGDKLHLRIDKENNRVIIAPA